MREFTKELGIPILTIIIFIGLMWLCFAIGKRGEKDIERLWKVVKYEFIIGLFTNIPFWAINSIKSKTIANVGLFVIIYLMIFFSMSALAWIHYKKTRLPFEKSSLFASVSDGYGSRGWGEKEGLSAGFAINLIFIILLTIFNIVYFIFGKY